MREDVINRIIDLQKRCNQMIDAYGECDHETADELEMLVDSLNWVEQGEMDEDYFKIAEARINSYEDYREFLDKKKQKI